MSHQGTPERASPRDGQRKPADEGNPWLGCAYRTSRKIRAALGAIPTDSVTARTAGALRVTNPRRTIADERAAFERGVAEENAAVAR